MLKSEAIWSNKSSIKVIENKFLLLLEFRYIVLIFRETLAWVCIAADFILVYCNRWVHSYCHINICTPGGQISQLLKQATHRTETDG